jgi:hypothetical protein
VTLGVVAWSGCHRCPQATCSKAPSASAPLGSAPAAPDAMGAGSETGSSTPTPEHVQAAKAFLTASGTARWHDRDNDLEAEEDQREVVKSWPAEKQAAAKKAVAEAYVWVGWAKVEDRVAQSLARDFTLQELQELTRFYGTPAGKKLAEVLLDRRVNSVTKELRKSPFLRLRDELEELQKRK